MIDGIDKTHFLPPDHPIVNATRHAHGDIRVVTTSRGGMQIRAMNSSLSHYYGRNIITLEQFRGGSRLHSVWWNNVKTGHVQSRYEESSGGGKPTAFVPPGFLATDYREAILSIRSMPGQSLAFAVCCLGEFAGRGKVELLRHALDDLASHFSDKDSIRNRLTEKRTTGNIG